MQLTIQKALLIIVTILVVLGIAAAAYNFIPGAVVEGDRVDTEDALAQPG